MARRRICLRRAARLSVRERRASGGGEAASQPSLKQVRNGPRSETMP